jgi:hypothetical protein
MVVMSPVPASCPQAGLTSLPVLDHWARQGAGHKLSGVSESRRTPWYSLRRCWFAIVGVARLNDGLFSAESESAQPSTGRYPPLLLSTGNVRDVDRVFAPHELAPQACEDTLRELGKMCPSKSSLDRLPKRLSEHREADRQANEFVQREVFPSCQDSCRLFSSVI